MILILMIYHGTYGIHGITTNPIPVSILYEPEALATDK